ncbi:hypothetical protein ACOMHN_040411 [Nucella lapillus]
MIMTRTTRSKSLGGRLNNPTSKEIKTSPSKSGETLFAEKQLPEGSAEQASNSGRKNEESGKVDAATEEMMKMPRCGNSDNIQLGNGARKKRYALQD